MGPLNFFFERMGNMTTWKQLLTTCVLAGLARITMPAAADTITYTASMSGANEVPPNASTATGFATLSLDGNLLGIHIEYAGLIGGTLQPLIFTAALLLEPMLLSGFHLQTSPQRLQGSTTRPSISQPSPSVEAARRLR